MLLPALVAILSLGAVAIVALPPAEDSGAELRSSIAIGLFIATAASLGVAALVAWWVNRGVFVPLRELVVAADRIAEGERSVHLPRAGLEELTPLGQAFERLAASVDRQLESVASERNHLTTVLGGMSEGVLVVDRSGRAELANRAFRAIFPFDGELRGRTLDELTGIPSLAQLAADSLAADETRRAEIETPSPPRRMLTATASSLANEAGGVVVVDDITEFVHLAEVRRDLVANVSHEIKTPLAAIRGYVETLQDGAVSDPEGAAYFLERTVRQCQRLQAILDDLLTLSRIESTEATVEREDLDLQHMLVWAADLLHDLAEMRGIEIHIDDGPPRFLRGDREALERLLMNLLDNAVKYNRAGGAVQAGLTTSGECLVLEVRDDGIGIPPAATSRVFERFYRVDKGRSRDDGGTGLGLAIVKHAARLHGGTVGVESVPGEGTTFRVEFPI